MSADDLPLLILGAGIGGLSAAIALSLHISPAPQIIVVEQAEALSEIGAGLQIGPNAAQVLISWGLGEAFREYASHPDEIRIFDGQSGAQLNHVPLGHYINKLYGAPYGTLHRADLQKILKEKATSFPNVQLKLNTPIINVAWQNRHSVTLTAQDGTLINGRALIAADGLWSKARKALIDYAPNLKVQAYYSGKTAYRLLVPASQIPVGLQGAYTGLWMGPHAHLVHYPVRGNDYVNLVAIIDEHWTGEAAHAKPDKNTHETHWNTQGHSIELRKEFALWTEQVKTLLERAGMTKEHGAAQWRKWPLYQLSPLPHWHVGPLCLLGDAAHPILPFLAQGGAMAIEDAEVLARSLQKYGLDNLSAAFSHYQNLRLSRTSKVQRTSAAMTQIYHMRGAMRLIRNQFLARQKPENLLHQYRWLYDYDIPEITRT